MAKVKYNYEALLRPVHEYWAVAAYLLGIAILLVGSEFMLLIPTIAYAAAALFFIRAIMRYRSGRYVAKYQHQLKYLKPIKMKPHQLLADEKYQYIGDGFEWGHQHVQRLFDLQKHKNMKYVRHSPAYYWAREVCYRKKNEWLYMPLVWFLSINTWINPLREKPDLEGVSYIHAVGMPEKERSVLQPMDTRVGHTLVLGTTRVGKTVLCRQFVAQDIRRGGPVIIFDPKGDADLLKAISVEVEKCNKSDVFHVLHLGFPEISSAYNPIGSFGRITEIPSRVANQMPDGGASSAFKQFVWGHCNNIIKTLVALGYTPNYQLIKEAAADIEPLAIEWYSYVLDKYLPKNEIKPLVLKMTQFAQLDKKDRQGTGIDIEIPQLLRGRGDKAKGHYLAVFSLYDKKTESFNGQPLSETEIDVLYSITKALLTDPKYMDKLVASLQPFLEKMTSGTIAKLIMPDFEDLDRPVFSWSEIIQQNGIVYIGLDALSDPEVAAAVGNSMFADLTSVAGRIYKYGVNHGLPEEAHGDIKKLCIHADEFNELAGTEFVPMLNKAGGANFQVTAYTQTLDDIEARVGSAAKAQQMIGNFNSVLFMRVLNEQTAKLLTSRFDKTSVSTNKTFTNVQQNSNPDTGVDFTSGMQNREDVSLKDLISTSELVQLPKGQGFALLGGNRLFKFRVPFIEWDESDMPNDLRDIIPKMRKIYDDQSHRGMSFEETFSIKREINSGEDKDIFHDFTQHIDELEATFKLQGLNASNEESWRTVA